MLDLLRVEQPAQAPALPTSAAGGTGAGAAGARRAATAAAASASSAPPLEAIKGLLYLRIVRVETAPGPGGKPAAARLPSLPTVEVRFEGESYTTAAARGDDAHYGHFEDEELILPVEHFFGGAMLTLDVATRSLLPLFGTRFGQASVSIGELVSGQVRLLLGLGINVRLGHLGTPGSPGEPGGDLARWERRGESATLQRLVLDLHGGAPAAPARITIESEFVFDRTGGPLGPRRMRLVHRAAAGGLVKLTRYVCSKEGSDTATSYGRVDTRAGAGLSLLPIDFCVLGSSAQHARTAQFLLMHHHASSRMAADSSAVFNEVFQPSVIMGLSGASPP